MNNYDQKRHHALGIYCVYVLIVLSLYNLSLEVLVRLYDTSSDTAFVTSAAIAVSLILFGIMVRRTGYPLSIFGFTTKNWLKCSIESLVFSITFCIFLTIVKWYLIKYVPIFKHAPLFDTTPAGFSGLQILIPVSLYVLFTPLQVFLAQSAVQSPLLEFLPAKNRAWLSVLVTSLLFSAAHVQLNIIFALGAFIPGLCWAIMYVRHRTLISVMISHALIGFWAFAILDFGGIFHDVDCATIGKGIDPVYCAMQIR